LLRLKGIMNIAESILKLFEKQQNTVEKDRFDDIVYRRHSVKIEDAVEKKMREKLPQTPPLVNDTFNTFFKPQPKFLPDEDIHPEFRINKTILQKLIKTEKFKDLKSSTVLDDLNSSIATITFLDVLFDELKKLERIEEIKKKTQAIQNLKKQLTNLPQEQQQMVCQITEQMNDIATTMSQTITQGVVSAAVRKASNNFDEMMVAMQSFGFGNQLGEHSFTSPEEAIEVATKLTSNKLLLEMVRELGRMRNLLRSVTKDKIKTETLELHSIKTGKNFERLLPTELIKLRKYKKLFWKDYADGTLLEYQLKQKQKEEKGPFIVALDISSSMKGYRIVWAKAVALATIELAMKEKREWAFIGFDVQVVIKKILKKPKPKDILELFSISASGGTAFEPPLLAAMEIIENKQLKNADILFITDGDCNVSEKFVREFRKNKRKTGTKVVSVLISGTPRTLKLFSDTIFVFRGDIGLSSAERVFSRLV